MTTHPCGGYPPPFRPTCTSTYPHHHPTAQPPRLSGSAKLLSPLPVSNCKRVAMSVLFPLHCSLSLAKFISHQERFYFCRGRSIAPTFPIYGRDLGSSGNPSGVGGGQSWGWESHRDWNVCHGLAEKPHTPFPPLNSHSARHCGTSSWETAVTLQMALRYFPLFVRALLHLHRQKSDNWQTALIPMLCPNKRKLSFYTSWQEKSWTFIACKSQSND